MFLKIGGKVDFAIFNGAPNGKKNNSDEDFIYLLIVLNRSLESTFVLSTFKFVKIFTN